MNSEPRFMALSCLAPGIRSTFAPQTSRRRSQLLVVLIFAAASLLTSCIRWEHMAERIGGDARSLHDIQYSTGDRWIDTTIYDLPRPPTALGLRIPIDIGENEFEGRAAGLYVTALARCELFWDGQPIGVTGEIDEFFVLTPEQTKAGTHLLTMRVEASQLASPISAWFYGITFGDYAHMVRSRTLSPVLPMLGVGAFLIVCCWYVSIWLSLRRAAYLVFAALCFAAALLGAAESWRALFGYAIEWHIVRLQIVSLLTLAVSLLLPLFLALDLDLRRPLLRIAALAPVLIIAMTSARSYDSACLSMFTISIIASITIVAGAAPRKRWAVLPAAIGTGALSLALVSGGFRFGDRSFFIAFVILILSLLVSLSMDLRRGRRRAARLEAELLKKNIQPHFVMNTLTAVMEWIEENPKEGVRFLESFAEELRIFMEIAGRPLIPLQTELDLCRAHLQVMSCRKGLHFDLQAEGTLVHEQIPPAIFHTLVENAISHNSYDDDRVSFRLREERLAGLRRYIFSAPLRQPERAGRNGVGMRYVTARLEESYPGRWRLDTFADGDAWHTAIEVPA